MKSEGERGGVSVASSDSSTGGLFSERFSVQLKAPINVPNHSPEHLLIRCRVLREVIWHLFLKIEAKVKNFLRLNKL